MAYAIDWLRKEQELKIMEFPNSIGNPLLYRLRGASVRSNKFCKGSPTQIQRTNYAPHVEVTIVMINLEGMI